MHTGKILIALTSHAELGASGRATGFYVAEAAHPWRVFTDAGYAVDLVSVRGGEPPRDGEDRADPVQAAFLDDPHIAAQLAATPTPDEVDGADYAAILYAGGHGTMWDFPGSAALATLGRTVYERGGVVGAVCHGPAALVDLRLSDGSLLVAGRDVAAFTDSEERAVGLTDVVPFPLQTRLIERGARHTGAPDFQPWVVRDGRLVTGQNPASAAGVAAAMLHALAATPAQVTASYFGAEGRRDLDAILDHFAEDARFVAPDGRELRGRDAIRPYYAANLAALPELRVDLVGDFPAGPRAALEWRAEGRNPAGEPVHMHGTNVVAVADGRFTEFRAYWLSRSAT
ncbi:nuclear transport factor 2 family protein [Actinoplanes sp. KI2]|uniref:nuclear transport factor 2 family protein n=1 Tax=Actinoplanes sp. KI2 TaxID=2983315 RepID=UPI0021D5823E|nr:nuclear transport factor 2 family protein [Actinoplanes sp. KI2]MCU7727860.1 nuclear transport factor 2 family protein [Actinoplanes sp. KI2]